MNNFFISAADLDVSLDPDEQSLLLVFVDAAEYEFVGGGASVINGA